MLRVWGYLNTFKTLYSGVVGKLCTVDWWLSYDIDLWMYACMYDPNEAPPHHPPGLIPSI